MSANFSNDTGTGIVTADGFATPSGPLASIVPVASSYTASLGEFITTINLATPVTNITLPKIPTDAPASVVVNNTYWAFAGGGNVFLAGAGQTFALTGLNECTYVAGLLIFFAAAGSTVWHVTIIDASSIA